MPDYTYAANKNGGAKLDVDEKRIYLPLFVYIAKGKPIRVTSGLSDLQTGSRDELTNEILQDEEQLFDDFFIFLKNKIPRSNCIHFLLKRAQFNVLLKISWRTI